MLVITIHVSIVLSTHPAIQRNLNEIGGRLPTPVRFIRHDLLRPGLYRKVREDELTFQVVNLHVIHQLLV